MSRNNEEKTDKTYLALKASLLAGVGLGAGAIIGVAGSNLLLAGICLGGVGTIALGWGVAAGISTCKRYLNKEIIENVVLEEDIILDENRTHVTIHEFGTNSDSELSGSITDMTVEPLDSSQETRDVYH